MRQHGCEEVRQAGSHLIMRCGKMYCCARDPPQGSRTGDTSQHSGDARALSWEGTDQVKTYTVVAERDEAGWWAVRVLELPGVLTQARRLDQVEKFARKAIDLAVSVGLAPKGKYTVQIDPRVPGFSDDLAAVRAVRVDAERLQAEAAERTRVIARRLAARGLTVRDIGAALGVSHQRAAQLVGKGSTPTSKSAAKKTATRGKLAPAKRRVPAS